LNDLIFKTSLWVNSIFITSIVKIKNERFWYFVQSNICS
jgi:hypothetical protein